MHELPVTESILHIALKHAGANNITKIISITLQIGKLSDIEEEYIQRYFDYLSKGSSAEDAKLNIEWTPIIMQCSNCLESYEINKSDMANNACPICGESKCILLSGREFYIKEMEVQ